jgi:hypothetical protein
MKVPLTLSPCLYPGLLLFLILNIACREKDKAPGVAPANESEIPAGKDPGEVHQPLITHRYTADPSAHVFEGKLFIYPSHDYESGIPADDLGSHFNMKDYHVFSMSNLPGEVTDHGKALALEDIPWAEKQLWAPDAAFKDGTYFFYFPAKDRDDIFRIGVATASEPQGPFVAQKEPIKNSYSIDPAVFRDTDGTYYMYFGGIWGGQLQRWASGNYLAEDSYPADDEPALRPKIARLSDDMLQFAEGPKEVQILDQEGNPLLAGDNDRRFFEAAWVHNYRGVYYLSYSTGDTHNIAYAVSDNPYGPFTYKGVVLEPVLGWTNHHSIVHYQGQWWLFFHDSSLSGGLTHLRSIKMAPLEHLPDGSIKTINALVEPTD